MTIPHELIKTKQIPLSRLGLGPDLRHLYSIYLISYGNSKHVVP